MTGLRLHHSNRLEVLAAELAHLARAGPGDPFAPERIVVPHPTIGRWLSLELARKLGIAANVRFEQPAEFAWSIMRGLVPDLSAERPYDPARLRWRIHDLLPGPAGTPGSRAAGDRRPGRSPDGAGAHGAVRALEGAVDGYLRDGDPRKRLELADRLARMYDQCLLYRCDWIRDWEGGAAPHWQARLWQRVVAADGPDGADHWVGALERFHRASRDGCRSDPADDCSPGPSSGSQRRGATPVRLPPPHAAASSPVGGSARPPGWPRRASFFAVPALSPSYLELLREMARGIEIHLFALNPCREYWGDIHSRREIGHRAEGNDPDARYLTEGNELLAAWGRAGRDGFDALVEIPDAEWDEHFVEPAGFTRLAAVQRDILDLRLADAGAREDASAAHDSGRDVTESGIPCGSVVEAPSASESSGAATRPRDDSLQIHVCHSPVREAEVLHDRLLAVFDAHPDLEPADVLVLTPDLEVYGPAVEAVFAAAGRIACNVAGARAAESRTLRAFLDLLALPGSRYGAQTVLAPLAAPAVRTRFGIAEADVAAIRDWVRNAGIRWGVDESHRGEEDLPANADHTWRHGLRRLLLGYAVTDVDEPIAGLVPCGAETSRFDADAVDGALLGRFVSYCEQVFGLRARLGARHRPARWGAVLRDVIRDFFADGSEPVVRPDTRTGEAGGRALARELADETASVRALVRDFEIEAANAETPVPVEVVRGVLRERTDARTHEAVRLADGATVAGLGPGRVFPAGVVCVVGMNDGAFPRSPSAPSFDVIAGGAVRRGDRDTRYDDRYAFLEALLAARRCFIVTHAGRGLRDDTPIPPSVLVDELKDYLHRRFPGEAVEVHHPLQPFSPRYFKPRVPRMHGETGVDAGLFSYSRGMCEAAKIVRAGMTRDAYPPRLAGVELPEPDASRRCVDLSELVAFFANPTRFFLRDRLGVRLELDDLSLEDEEPFELDNLERHRLREDLWEQMTAGIEAHRGAALLYGSGRLPQEGLGRIVEQQAREEVEPLAGMLAPYRGALDSEPLAVDFELDGFRVVGAIEHVDLTGAAASAAGASEAEPARMVWWRIASLRARDRIAIRLRQLAWTAAGRGAMEAFAVWRERGEWKSATFPPPDDASEELGHWLRARWRGLAAPLAVFPETSMKFAQAIARAPDGGDGVREAAREKARAAWFGDQHTRGEVLDPYRALVYDERDPLTDEFEELAALLLGRLVETRP